MSVYSWPAVVARRQDAGRQFPVCACRYAVLEIVLVSVLGWGVVGAALAPAIGQYCGLVVMLTLLFRERALLPEHFTSPPSLASIMPLLKVNAVAHRDGCRPPVQSRSLCRLVIV